MVLQSIQNSNLPNDEETNEDDIPRKNNNVDIPLIMKSGIKEEITKQVVRKKLAKQRHLVIQKAIHPEYLDSLFPTLVSNFQPQTVHYNGGIAQVKEWKISCYLEVMPGGIPCTNPNLYLLEIFRPLLDTCNELFAHWYRQQHACNHRYKQGNDGTSSTISKTGTYTVTRLMTFVTRYTPNPGEQALLKHVDGAGKVDGSIVVALPMDYGLSSTTTDNASTSIPNTSSSSLSAASEASPWLGGFEGGGLTVWDGRDSKSRQPLELHYDTRSGDVAFLDRAVWHQADPITRGIRWALVIFYQVSTTS